MKKTLTAFLPALTLLTLGSCATTSQLASTEDDGVYYSSKDRTTQVAPAATASRGQAGTSSAPADNGTDEATNPEYRTGSTSSNSGSASGSEYYDDDYGYSARIRRFSQPVYRGFGYGYYDAFYTDPFWYGGSPYAYGYSPYGWGPGYYGSFYDPFYSPYAYGGTYISINIGFGRPYYNPWRYGYGGYGYGGYGYGGYGGGYYDGYRNGYYNGLGSTYGSGVRTHYGPRRDGARDAMSSSMGTANGGRGRGRMDTGGVANPTGGVSNNGGFTNTGNGGSAPAVVPGRGRGRMTDGSAVGTGSAQDAAVRQQMGDNSGRILTDQQNQAREGRGRQLSEAADQPRLDTRPSRGGWRVVDNGGRTTDVTPATSQDYAQPRRGRSQDMQPASNGTSDQPVRQPRQRVFGDFNQPSQSNDQPVRQQRTYSEPSRSSSPSGNFGGGGGNSGGGGGSRGRGRM